MAFTADAATAGAVDASSFSHTAGASAKLIVAVVICRSSVDDPTGVTYGGQALTQAVDSPGNSKRLQLWYLVDPPTGANTLAISAGVPTDDNFRMYGVSVNADDTVSLDDTGAATGASGPGSVTIDPTVDNTYCIAGLSHEDGSAPSTGSGETVIFNHDNGTWASGAEYAIQTTATSQAMNWTGPDDAWAAAAASFKETAAGGTTRRYSLPVLGVG